MTLNREALMGVHCALVTPVGENGGVDRLVVRELIGALLEAGVSGLVPVGGTGEYAALAPRRRAEMVEATVEAASGRVPVVAGVLSPGFHDAMQAGLDFMHAGADGLLLITPYYTTPTQAGIRTFFQAYAEAVDAPLLLYDIPARTGVAVTSETVAALADEGVIVGMKACNRDFDQFLRLIGMVGDRIAVMSGEEPFFAAQVAMGATGGILATANLVPGLWREVYELARRGDLLGAQRKQEEMRPFLEVVFAETNPGPLKAAMRLAGRDVGRQMLPLLPPSSETMIRLEAVVPGIMARERAIQRAPTAAISGTP